MNKTILERLRDLSGYLSLWIGKRIYHRYQLGDKVMYFNVERNYFDEARVVSATGWGQYTVENPDGDRMIFDEKDLRPYRNF